MCSLVPRRTIYFGKLVMLHLELMSNIYSNQTGGQDDLLTIFSPWEQRVVARCQGHSSFVSAVAFDEVRCDGRTYRLGSVGEDNKLILVGEVRAYTSYSTLNCLFVSYSGTSPVVHFTDQSNM